VPVTNEDLAARLDIIEEQLAHRNEDVGQELSHVGRLLRILIRLQRRRDGAMTPEDEAELEQQIRDQAENLKGDARPPAQ
jgi:exopolyphosphatase/pppGpp-phosphohydrolase